MYFSVCVVGNCTWMQLGNIDSHNGGYANNTMIFFCLTSCLGKSGDGKWSGAVRTSAPFIFLMQNSLQRGMSVGYVFYVFSQFRRVTGWLQG